jgi:hypothetical protein
VKNGIILSSLPLPSMLSRRVSKMWKFGCSTAIWRTQSYFERQNKEKKTSTRGWMKQKT